MGICNIFKRKEQDTEKKKNIRVKEEDRPTLEFAYGFLVNLFREESRSFWTKVLIVVTVNSLLLAGFALLYSTKTDAKLLLWTIAGCGILALFLWIFLSWQAWRTFNSLGNEINQAGKLIQKNWYKRLDIEIQHGNLMNYVKGKNFAGMLTVVTFFFIFLAIWGTALYISIHTTSPLPSG